MITATLVGGKRTKARIAVIQKRLREDPTPVKETAEVILQQVVQEAPVRTGRLKRSLKLFRRGKKTYGIGSRLDYMLYVTRGTRRQSPNPFPSRALKKVRGRAKRTTRREYKKLLRL